MDGARPRWQGRSRRGKRLQAEDPIPEGLAEEDAGSALSCAPCQAPPPQTRVQTQGPRRASGVGLSGQGAGSWAGRSGVRVEAGA